MTLPEITKISIRNLSRSKRRNVILGIAIAFGFFVVTVIDGLAGGAVSNLEDMTTQLMGGSVVIAGYEKVNENVSGDDAKNATTEVNVIRAHDYLQNLVDEMGIDYKYTSHYTRTMSQIIFHGKKVLAQTNGRDFATDKTFVESLQIKDGDISNLSDPRVLIVGEGMAKTLKVEVGDEVLLTTTTIYGQNEVGDFKVGLIIKDSNFVTGMVSYADIRTLNKLIDIPEDGYNIFSIYLTDKNKQDKVAVQIEDAVKNDGVPVTDLREARRKYPGNPEKGLLKHITGKENQWEGTKYLVESLNDGAPLLKSAMAIVHLVTTIILIVILLITMVGISNTYRMVLYERIREIGTMRAIGMAGRDTGHMFTMEAVILCVLGGIAGLVLGIIVMMVLGMINIEFEPVQLFLKKGHMSFTLSPLSIIIQYAVMVFLTTLAVRGTAKKAARMSPAEALRTVK
ncbi:MAG: FtsX-like permease family protein [Treponema sp.]|nr:FtsX-like permease family protein [Treponema sp.]